MRDDDGLQLDFMDVIDGVPSFEGLRRRSLRVRMGAASLSPDFSSILAAELAIGR